MIKINNRGFTLIELIISISVLTICSTMLIVGIVNMTNIFSEGSLIKTNTNTIYNNIVSKIGADDLNYNENSILTLKNGNNTFTIHGFSEITDQLDDPSLIKLTYLDPALKAENYSVDVSEPEQPVDAPYGATLVALTDFNHIPTTYFRFSSDHSPDISAFDYLQTIPDEVPNCITMKPTNYIFGPSTKSIVVNNPEKQFLTKIESNISAEYKTMLNGSYSVRYASINPISNWRYLYCYLVPKEKGIYVNYVGKIGLDGIVGKWIPWNQRDKLDSILPTKLKNFSTTIANSTTKTYTREELLSDKFLNDFEASETFFNFYGSE